MDDADANRRTIAACEHCGALYAALEFSNETIRPIGRRDGCRCGSTEFSAIEDGSMMSTSCENESEK
ncbi:hypothetical protein [Natrinema halophilum]|uniref:Uncharacterized protein n=1 Tax=Natrinema halophilum TaxID=1699371 RepID=A0A7D5KRG3_9EURY|nr:hypothetical protein [Natrinema halophilum]QLG48444.1 hypothetical protein HYG82_06070 [Natrinema halophilum]